MVGGQLELAMDPPTVEPHPKEGLINIRNFTIKGEGSLDRVAAGGPPGGVRTAPHFHGCARNSPGRTGNSR